METYKTGVSQIYNNLDQCWHEDRAPTGNFFISDFQGPRLLEDRVIKPRDSSYAWDLQLQPMDNELMHPLVKMFYELRCEAEGIRVRPN